MKLNQQEKFGLKMLFRNKNKRERDLSGLIDKAKVICRENTGVGFFTTIKLEQPVDEIPNCDELVYTFDHPDFLHGGTFSCCFLDKSTIELEGVTFCGEDWPFSFDVTKSKKQVD